LCYALVARVMAWMTTGRASSGVMFADGFADSEEARAAAARSGDYVGFIHAALSAGACLDGWVSWEYIRYTAECREELIRLGAPHVYVAILSTDEAPGLLMLGDWRACEDRLRVALGATPGTVADINARLSAALLACWHGKLGQAQAHLARAEEIVLEKAGYVISYFDAVRAELAAATGDTVGAVSAALAGLQLDVPPNFVERLLPLAARALANDIQLLRDRGKDPSSIVSQLDDLRCKYPTVRADLIFGPMYRLQLRAMQALYDAEQCRGRLDPAAGNAWLTAADACQKGQLAWDEAYANWRAAEALAKDRTARDAAAAALRRAHELAVDLQAAPLLADVEALAQSARISLAAVDESQPSQTGVLPSLTPREREILAHIVAGRTYGEIARELVLSEKTVSVHVSHLLHKTGTTNRVDLAQLARRVATSATD
jgi:DNA-binding CsgD family transcriptional regulator